MNQNQANSTTPYTQWAGRLVCLLALILYLATLCHSAFPVQSSALVTAHAGIDPFQSYQNSLWSMLLHLLNWIPVGGLALKANVLSVPLAVLSLWLMYYIVSNVPHNRTTEETLSGFNPKKVGAVSGAFAAAYLAVSPPFWFMATRAHPLSVNILLLLGCVALLIRQSTGETGYRPLYLFSLLFGISLAQFPTMFLLAPLLGLWVLYLLWASRGLTVGRVAILLSGSMVGYASILLVAAWFMTTAAFDYREISGLGQLLWSILRDQYLDLRGAPAKSGCRSFCLPCCLGSWWWSSPNGPSCGNKPRLAPRFCMRCWLGLGFCCCSIH